jgi:hypothetical protein
MDRGPHAGLANGYHGIAEFVMPSTSALYLFFRTHYPWLGVKDMEIIIELTDKQLDLVAGGSGTASLTFSQSASGGTTTLVSATVTQSTTASSASQSGIFITESEST